MKYLKKTLLAVLTLCAAACAAGAMGASCNPDGEGGNGGAGHNHVWDGGTQTTPATCTEDGVKTFACTVDGCTETKTEPIDKLGHDWGEWSVTKLPEEYKKGEVSASCKRTGCTEKHTAELPMTYDINYSRTADNATCTDAGSQHFAAEIEGKTVEFDIPTLAKGHVWSTWSVTKPTDTAEGEAVRTCKVDGCGTEERHALPVTGSADYDKQTFPANCTDDGQEVYSISFGEEKVQFTNVLPATGHDMQTGDVSGAESGDIIYDTCKNDGCTYKANPFTYFVATAANSGSSNYGSVALGSYYFKSEIGSTWFSLDLTVGGTYKIEFEYFSGTVSAISQVGLDDMSTRVVYAARGAGKVQDAYAGVATIAHNGNFTQSFTFDAGDYVGSKLIFFMQTAGTPEFKMNITVDRDLKVGSNSVYITDAGSFVDTYTFVSDTDKVYSMTVPENVAVLMGDDDFIIDSTYKNFEAKAGVPITFTFSNGAKGKIVVLIGDEIVPPELTVGCNPVSLTITANEVASITVGDEVAEGTYKIVITGPFLSSRAMGCGSLYFQLNGNPDYASVTTDGMFMSPTSAQEKNGWVPACSQTVWTVTLTLKAGDVVYFAPAQSRATTGSELGYIGVTLEAVS